MDKALSDYAKAVLYRVLREQGIATLERNLTEKLAEVVITPGHELNLQINLSFNVDANLVTILGICDETYNAETVDDPS